MSILPEIFYNYFIGTNNIPELKKNEYNKFYYLSLINEGENKWSIHGLWPQYKKNQYPTFCNKVDFDIKKLDLILPELEKYWYSYKKNEKDDENFWKHEWEKHGSCMFTVMNEFDYFNKTLELYNTAIQIDIPHEFYDEKTNKCLIPITLDFKFDL
tara:strand:- start:68 stop:535 length:468 start_codon:yes stop_codon:yes gene_type:complete